MDGFENYYNNELKTPYVINQEEFIEKIKNDERFIFVKYGDGEFYCMNNLIGANCDNDTYCQKLNNGLIESFYNLLEISNNENVYIGKWHNLEIVRFYLALCYIKYQNTSTKIPFVDYRICLPYFHYNENHNIFNIVKYIQKSKRYKIVISNDNNTYHKHIFKGDIFIEVPKNSWFINGYYDSIYNKIRDVIKEHPYALILISAGMGSKVIATNLFLEFKEISIIDVGSAFDLLSQKKATRDYHLNYDELYDYFKPLLEYQIL